jgi:hypothetical protein
MTERHSVNHNLNAVEKALLSGLTAVAVGDHYLVPSRTTSGKMYSPRVSYSSHGVIITCDCQAGHTQAPAGSTPCWHGALAMVQEQAADRARFDGRRWVAGGNPPELVHRGYTDNRPKCPVCNLALDRDVIIPVHRQVVTDADGASVHRGCNK